MSWSRPFDRPIKLPGGKIIKTLGDARDHLLSLPKDQHQAPAFIAAAEAVVLAGEQRGPVMHANVGMAQLVHGPIPPPEPRPSTTRPWGKINLLRDR